jgi:hypothetical protein
MVKFWIEPVIWIMASSAIGGEFGSNMPFGCVKLYLVARQTISGYFLVRSTFMTFHTIDVMAGSEGEGAVIEIGCIPARSVYCMTFHAIGRVP